MRRTLIAAALAAALFAGCGDDDEEQPAAASPSPTEEATQEPAAGGGEGETLRFSAPEDGSLKFDQGDLTTQAGMVTVEFSNPSTVPHAVEIEGNGVEEVTETVTEGDAPPIEVELQPGTYTFYCPVGDHEAAGMKGTLTVE
jgi:plastocyanin